MPCTKFKGGYRIKRGGKSGYYPKLYSSKKACEIRVGQMKAFKHSK